MVNEDRRPVPVKTAVKGHQAYTNGPPGHRLEQAEKLARRLAALPAGRFIVIVTTDRGGLVDWSIMDNGKVEK